MLDKKVKTTKRKQHINNDFSGRGLRRYAQKSKKECLSKKKTFWKL